MCDGEARHKRQQRQKLIYALFALTLLVLTGLYDSPIALFNKQSDLTIEPEYFSGILAGSAILFGIWVIFIGNKPKDKDSQWAHKYLVLPPFKTSFAFLILSVVLIALTGAQVFSPILALFFLTMSFVLNAIFIYITLRYVNP